MILEKQIIIKVSFNGALIVMMTFITAQQCSVLFTFTKNTKNFPRNIFRFSMFLLARNC